MNSVKIRSYATVANLGCGFDVLGLCLQNPYDEIEVSKSNHREVTLTILESKYDNIPSDPDMNTGGVPAKLIMKDFNLDFGFDIKIKKGIPLCGGLGSSAATSVGVVSAINYFLENKLSDKKLLYYALEGEKVSVTNPHADNIAPCLFGGLNLIRDMETLDIIKVPISEFYISIIHPDIKINTEDARNILPEKIDLSLAIKQWGNLGALINAFNIDDKNLIKKSMIDKVVEPIRSKLINGFDDIKVNALDSGAIACSISGSGPSVFALCDNKEIASNIAQSSVEFYKNIGMKCDSFISSINHKGPTIVDEIL